MDRLQSYREAERSYWAAESVRPTERTVTLKKLGLELRVLEIGAGDPILFVHGGGGLASGWAPLWRGWGAGRLIGLDRPGCGLSQAFSYRGADLRRHAVDVLEGVLDALDIEQAALVGNSMGGLWSFWLALDRPSRVSAIVQMGCPALILDTSAPLPMRLMSIAWLGRLMQALEPPSRPNARKIFARMGHDPASLPDALLDLVVAAGSLPAFADSWLSLIGSALSLGGARVPLGADELRRVSQPVHLLWGRSDPFGGLEAGRRVCAALPHASLDVAGNGHLPWLDEPERCRLATEAFLAGVRRARPAASHATAHASEPRRPDAQSPPAGPP